MKIRLTLILALLLATNLAFAQKLRRYEVSITNITKGQTFTPQLVAVHNDSVSLFALGKPASSPLAILAEGGDTGPLMDHLLGVPDDVGAVTTIGGLLAPGETATVEISSHRRFKYLSFVAMLIPTNDTFVALSGIQLPSRGSVFSTALAYDAGTEENDQLCINIPGPRCMGEGFSLASDTDEGFIYISNGFHELGSVDADDNEILGPLTYDWRNPVAHVTITRLKK